MTNFVRKVGRLAPWKESKDKREVLSHDHADIYQTDLTLGKGLPSIWQANTEEDYEKIALGMQLRAGRIDSVRLIVFSHECLQIDNLNLLCNPDPSFPVISVRNNHYELNTNQSIIIGKLAENFVSCMGDFKEFFKALKEDPCNMKKLAEKHIDDVDRDYQDLARKWFGSNTPQTPHQ
jgi:hypothetical protein